jgi:hypothetical protein
MTEAEERLHAKLDEWFGGYLQANFPEWAHPSDPTPADLGLEEDQDLLDEAFGDGWRLKLLRYHHLGQEKAATSPWGHEAVVTPPATPQAI